MFEFNYLTFNNAIVITARMIPMIQNLTTIFASGIALAGFVKKAGMPSFWK